MLRSPRLTPKTSQNANVAQNPLVNRTSGQENATNSEVNSPNVSRPASTLPNMDDLLSYSAQNPITPQDSENLPQNIMSQMSGNNSVPNSSLNITLTQGQFMDLLGGLTVRQEPKSTFANCSARFNGGRSSSKVDDFIATILVLKMCPIFWICFIMVARG